MPVFPRNVTNSVLFRSIERAAMLGFAEALAVLSGTLQANVVQGGTSIAVAYWVVTLVKDYFNKNIPNLPIAQ